MSQKPIKIDETDASGGKTGVGVRRVLIGGLVLVVVVFVVLFFALR